MNTAESPAEKRNFKRYNVSGLNLLQGKMDDRYTDLQLITLGFGGCGFIGKSQHITSDKLPKRVHAKFEFSNVTKAPVEIQGNLIYIREIAGEQSMLYFYGVEFIPSHRDRLKTIVEELEKLVERKVIVTA